MIPARLASQRLPRKMLRMVAGRPLLAWTVEAARACPQFSQVVVAVDSEELAALCVQEGWTYQMTSPELPSGTDRLHAVSLDLAADLYVNVQGDEPLITAGHIEALIEPFRSESGVGASTLKIRCTPEEIDNPNVVKVVTSSTGRAMYFSRSTIPFDRDQRGGQTYYKHLGLYAYRKSVLARFASLPVSELERAEKLEQLRLLQDGIAMHVGEVALPTVGVDTEEDLRTMEALLLDGMQR